MHKHSDRLAEEFRSSPVRDSLDGLSALRALSYYETPEGWSLTPAARFYAFSAQPRASVPSARAGSCFLAWALWQGLRADAARGYNEATRDGASGWRSHFGTLGAYDFALDSCKAFALMGEAAAHANIDEVVSCFDAAFTLLVESGATRLFERGPLSDGLFRAVPLELLLVVAQALNFDHRLVEHRPRVDPAEALRWRGAGLVPLGLLDKELWSKLEGRIGVLSAPQRIRRWNEVRGLDWEWICIPRVMRSLIRAERVALASGEAYQAL